MIKKNFGIIVVLWAAFASMASAQDLPELAAARAQAVASAVYNVVPRPESEKVQRRQFAEALAKAFLTGEGNYVDRLLEPYSMEPRARVSRELLLGVCHLASGDQQRAAAALEKASVLTPDYPEVFIELGRLAFRENRFADALAHFEKAERLCDDGGWSSNLQDHFETRTLDGYANVALAQGRNKEALDYLCDLDRRLPDDPSVLKRLGETAFQLEDYDSASKYLEDCSELVPELAPAEVQMASMAIRAKQYKQARGFLDQATARYRDDPRALAGMTQLFLEMDDPDRALKIIAEAERSETPNATMVLLEGQARFMTGEIEAAQRLFESLTRLAPNNLGYSNLYALALAADTDLQSRSLARRLALKNLRISPNQLNVLSVAGWLEYSQGSKLNGKKLMSRLEQQAEASGVSIDRDTAFFLAFFQSDQGRMNEAIKLLEVAIAAPGVFMHKRRAEELLQRLQALPANSGPLR